MDTLMSMRVFRQVVERGNFIGAALQLGISAAMASKHVAHLERQLGSRLLNRTSRHVSLTEAGTVYYEQCSEALDTLEVAEASLSGSVAEPRGTLKLTAPVWCANAEFAAVLARYKERYPKVVLDLRLTNWKVDLAEEGFDLALRASGQDLPALIVRPICPVRFVLVATPAYLAQHGALDYAAQLGTHAAVLPSYTKLPQLFSVAGTTEKNAVRLPLALKSDDTTLAYHAVLAGVGIGFLPEWLIGADLTSGKLQRVLTDLQMPTVTLYAAYTSRKYLTSKVRTFIDFLSASFAERLPASAKSAPSTAL